MTRRLSSTLLLTCALVLASACDPDAKSVGEGLPEDDAMPTASDEVQWRVAMPLDTIIKSVVATNDGGAALVRYSLGLGTTRLERYSAEGTLTFSTSLPGYPRQLAVAGDEFLVVGDESLGEFELRATVTRLSGDGEVVAKYLHSRERKANAYGWGVAVRGGEVAMMVGNWGGLDPGEHWFEIVRLSLDLDPIAPSLGFDNLLGGVGYDPDGTLVVLETIEDGPDLVHRIDAGEPMSVDCRILLADGDGPSLCSNQEQPSHLTMLDSGDTHTIETLGTFIAQMTRRSSLILTGMVPYVNAMTMVELDESMGVLRVVEIAGTMGNVVTSPSSVAQAPDGAVYIAAMGQFDCDDEGSPCVASELLRIAPHE